MAGPKSAQRQFYVKVDGIDGHFATKSGGGISSDTTKVYDGGDPVPYVLAGPAEAENITVGRPYQIGRDDILLAQLRNRVGRDTYTITVTPTDRDLVARGKPVTYSDALLVGVTEADVDAGSGDAATIELEFAVSSYV